MDCGEALQKAVQLENLDSDLARVLDSWATLSAETKTAILCLLITSPTRDATTG